MNPVFLLSLLVLALVFPNVTDASFTLQLTNAGTIDVPNSLALFYTTDEFTNHEPSKYNVSLIGLHNKLQKILLTDNYTFMALDYPDGTETHIEAINDGCMNYIYPGAPYPCNG